MLKPRWRASLSPADISRTSVSANAAESQARGDAGPLGEALEGVDRGFMNDNLVEIMKDSLVIAMRNARNQRS